MVPTAGTYGSSLLVSIGIPTYERVDALGRALESALAQTYTNLEIVISDNASQDGTEDLCRRVAARDSRVRYLRQEVNRGSTANFNTLFAACRGRYVAMLADDDWMDPKYVSVCLRRLLEDESLAVVAGRPRYVQGEKFVSDGVSHHHVQPDGGDRVCGYLASVDDNGVFYGLIRRSALARAIPLPDVLGNDWLHVARLAYQGGIETLDTVRINRQIGGTSVDVLNILRAFGRPRWQARVPQLVMAWELLADIGWRHAVYEPLGRVGRLRLAARAAVRSMRWKGLAWHLVTPTVARLRHRRRGRHLWSLYERLTRALGAGRRR